MNDHVDSTGRRKAPEPRRTRVVGVALSVAAHLALVPLLFMTAGEPPVFLPPPNDFDAIVVDLSPPPLPPEPVQAPEPDPAEASKAPAKSAEPPTPTPIPKPRPTPPPPLRTRPPRPTPANIETVVANTSPTPAAFVGLTDAELGGATVAGSGAGMGAGGGAGSGGGSGSGGACDMVRRIQNALRADPEIREAALQAHRAMGSRRALLMWNGDWLPSPGQVGRGLAGVRQAIALEVAFAPAACREQSMRGLALVTLGDGPDSPRIALGAARWRWSELAKGR